MLGTRHLWFHGAAKHTQPGRGQCVADWRHCLKDEELTQTIDKQQESVRAPQWHSFILLTLDLCIQTSGTCKTTLSIASICF